MRGAVGEPRLTAEDRRIWDRLERTALAWAGTSMHGRRVDESRKTVLRMFARVPEAWVAWSAGKDSTAMTHLISRVHPGVRVMSVKDDLDFPGEEEYVRRLGAEWGVKLDVVRPPFSLQEWVRDHAGDLGRSDDLHGRAAGLSRDGFYAVLEAHRVRNWVRGVFLGLRKHESHGRLMNRNVHGLIYKCEERDQVICQPIADWEGMDVFAYLFSRGIEPLPMYRCVRMAESPERVRKSWWLPGASARKGGEAWLKTYWPSLYGRMLELVPNAGTMA